MRALIVHSIFHCSFSYDCISSYSQVISEVGDLVGIKYFPAEPKTEQEDQTLKLD